MAIKFNLNLNMQGEQVRSIWTQRFAYLISYEGCIVYRDGQIGLKKLKEPREGRYTEIRGEATYAL